MAPLYLTAAAGLVATQCGKGGTVQALQFTLPAAQLCRPRLQCRQAKPGDADIVHGLVCELAAFEQQAGAVKVSVDQLRRDMQVASATTDNNNTNNNNTATTTTSSTSSNVVDAAEDARKREILAKAAERRTGTTASAVSATENAGGVLGCAIFFETYSTWEGRCLYLEDLYVRPEARGKGGGTALLAAVARVAHARGCPRLQWQALDWNKKAIAFYIGEQINASERIEEDGARWLNFILKPSQIEALARKATP